MVEKRGRYNNPGALRKVYKPAMMKTTIVFDMTTSFNLYLRIVLDDNYIKCFDARIISQDTVNTKTAKKRHILVKRSLGFIYPKSSIGKACEASYRIVD